jgi:hypothetical protein
MRYPTLILAVVVLMSATSAFDGHTLAQAGGADTLHKPLDQILDVDVRDGYVYYRALRSERARLDRYVASLNVPAATYQSWSREQQMAFWVNAYNAFVLETVIDHYPIKGSSKEYPVNSVRQVPGAFEQIKHRAAGQNLTLDEIEKKILPPFKEPRLYLALGRGAVGSGRLRSEAFVPARLEEQLAEAAAECVTRAQCAQLDRDGGKIAVSSIFSWHEKEFADTYADKAPPAVANRSPIERGVVAFVFPKLLPGEREMVEKNTFQLVYKPFDWTLNDLTGRGGR